MDDGELEILLSINAERERESERMIDMLHKVTDIASVFSLKEIDKHANLLNRIREHGSQTRKTQSEFQRAWMGARKAEEKRQLIAQTTAIH